MRKLSRLQVIFWLSLSMVVATPLASRGQTHLPRRHAAEAADRTFPALLVSDIHFDPFHDPARVQQLVDAPESQWNSILSAPPSPNQAQAFAELQQTCHARGVDTPYPLLRASLQAMRSRQSDARFIMLSGDLLAHEFFCRYKTLFPIPAQEPTQKMDPRCDPGTRCDYQLFVLKTLSFVMEELRASFPGVPVYGAVGNNDTGCGDYRLDAASNFLAQSGAIFTEGLPPAQQRQARKIFAQGGYYSVPMGKPMRHTRLIVVNDILQSPSYKTCAGRPDPAAANVEMAWLREQLAEARRSGQKVWVMGHIPPGVDPFLTVAKLRDVCGSGQPEMFLSSNTMADLLIEYADVIRLGLFAHSHMDEMRLLQPPAGDPALEHSVAIKIIPSISPVDGNNPAFTIARINPATALLRDYQVIAASNLTGIDTAWSAEYDYAESYHAAQFSPSALQKLFANFENDRDAKTEASREYIRDYYVGNHFAELAPFWPKYICALANYTAKSYAACVCSPGK
jgi:sphingomyelin phosphodiesterase acid-like 3